MSTPPKAVRQAQSILGAFPGKRLLLVEGPQDKAIYSIWLKKVAHPQLFASRVEVEVAGNKSAVLSTLEWFRDHGGNPPHLFGLVDRDEWDDTTLATQLTAICQLRVAPGRDCLESYFTDPDELEPALLAENPSFATLFPPFRASLQAALPARVDHWSLFVTTERLKERMNAAIYPGAFHATIPIPSDAEIQLRFQVWAGLVAHPNVFNEFDALCASSQAVDSSTKFRSHVCAKQFFKEVVCPSPEGLQRFRNKPEDTWKIDLAEHALSVPADIAAILQPLLV